MLLPRSSRDQAADVVEEVCVRRISSSSDDEGTPSRVVILDIGMPVLNGIEAAKRIRQDSPASKIIFATQNDEAEIKIEALASGAEAYLLKANAASELVPSIEAALKDGHDHAADSHR